MVFADVFALHRHVPSHAISTATAAAVASRQVSAMSLMLLNSRTCSAHSLISLHTSSKRRGDEIFSSLCNLEK